jgi:hypothetical protein
MVALSFCHFRQRFVFMTAAVFEAVFVHRGWTKLIKQNYILEYHPQLA